MGGVIVPSDASQNHTALRPLGSPRSEGTAERLFPAIANCPDIAETGHSPFAFSQEANFFRSKMPSKLKRLAIPPVSGVLHVGSDAKGGEVVLSGDPRGLRSLARVLEALADIDQSKLVMPPEAKEHIHLDPELHLDRSSVRLVVSRADFASGEIDDSVAVRGTGRARAIREYREHKKP